MHRSKIVGIGLFLIISSCTTYTIPIESFRNQMMKATSKNVTEVEINNPLLSKTIKYLSNNIDKLIVTDKNGNRAYLHNSPSIEMRITHSNGKKYLFYFDTVILENNTLKGGRSRFSKNLTRAIPIDSIVKIEIQNSGKNFKYLN